MKFLEKLALDFYKREGAGIRELCFVFPNRRSGLFFRKYIASFLDKPLFSPAIITLKDMVVSLSNKREADRLELLFDLYHVYREISKTPESFDDFVYWGEIILNDFNDTDKYLVDAKQLFSNVKELKEIESDYSFLSPVQLEAVKNFWEGFLPEGDSINKKSFIATWELLYPLYSKFRQKLEDKEAGYSGMLYQEVALNKELLEPLREYRNVIFVGFNALNQCEKEIFKAVQSMNIADFYWDYESELIKDSDNKASYFMNYNLSNFPSKHYIISAIDRGVVPEIEVIGVASAVIQAKITGEILKEIPGTIENAVVLPDESLLMPVLNSVPENIERINITMGYPITGTPVLSLVMLITEMEWESRGIYYKRVLSLLNHSYTKKLAGSQAQEILDLIVKENIIYAKRELFEKSDFLKLLFLEIPTGENSSALLCDKIISILDLLSVSSGISKIEKEFIYHVHTAVTRIKGILIPMTIKTFARLLGMLTQGITIPFRGEPLSGLQIMGALETRTLDFDNLIICSVNEGIFPKRSISNSFIPYNLRIGFGLPVKEHEDALYSYLFYRLISRAKKVYLLYDTRTEGLKNGEASRFILQLKYLYNLPITEREVTYRVEPQTRKEIIIKKANSVLEKLNLFLQLESDKTLSASALNTYIDCPLQFYFSYIEGVKAQEEVSEELEASEFGSIFHFVMERLYKPYEGQSVTKESIKALLSNESLIEHETDQGFLKYKNISNPKGYALLIKRLIIKYVQITLRHDLSETPFDYLGAEKRLTSLIPLSSAINVPLKGFLDRLDKKSSLRIVDYKTGKGDMIFRDIESLFDSSYNKRNRVAFQMFLYSLLLDYSGNLIAEPYFIRELAKNKIHRLFIDDNEKEEFRSMLIKLLEEIFNPEVPFTATANRDICEWCDFNSICY